MPTTLGLCCQCMMVHRKNCPRCPTLVSLCKSAYGLEVPNDFIILATKAMIHLKGSKWSNVLYNIAKRFGEMREDQSDYRFPTDRMPMGLLEYMAGFFAVDEMRKVCICYTEY